MCVFFCISDICLGCYSMFALILQVGTCRALHSKCHPRHFFTPRSYSHPTQPILQTLTLFFEMRAAPSRRVARLYLRTPPVVKFLSCYTRTNFPTFPRSYCHSTQPKYTKNEPKSKLLLVFLAFVRIFLYLCAQFE